METKDIFAVAYLVCALIAFFAARSTHGTSMEQVEPFWRRLALVTAVFGVLRYFGAQMISSSAVRQISHTAGLTDWTRPGPFIMVLVVIALAISIAGLVIFTVRRVHVSVMSAALSTVLLIILAVSHSVSLHVTGVYLQASVGMFTVSRIIETFLLAMFAMSGVYFVLTTQSHGKNA